MIHWNYFFIKFNIKVRKIIIGFYDNNSNISKKKNYVNKL